MKRHRSLLVALLGTLLATSATAAPVKRTVCIFDPGGATGDAYNMMKAHRNAAVAWGVELNLKPYTDEKTAVEDFKAGKCSAALLTGVRARSFNRFSGSIEAMGGLQSYAQLKSVITTLSKAKAAKLMRRGAYETAAVFPAGAVYLFVRNRNITKVGDLAGKRIATLDFDRAAKVMVTTVGASLVVADVGTFAGMFNNGGVHACYAPATAYLPMELRKGLGKQGGVIKYPLAQLTMQLIVRTSDFPEGFGQQSRAWTAAQYSRMLKVVQKAERSIPSRYWIKVPTADQAKYDNLFRTVRIRLRDKEKVFDRRTLKLLRRIRCQSDAGRAECAEKLE